MLCHHPASLLLMGMAKPGKLKPHSTSVRLPEDLREQLEKAVHATGASGSSLIVDCLREALKTVTQRKIKFRREAEKDL